MTTSTVTLPALAEPVVRQYARSLVAKSGKSSAAPVLILRAKPTWNGPEIIPVPSSDEGGEVRVHVKPCVSSLAIREAMHSLPSGDYLVVLSDRTDSDLDLGILSFCFDQRVVTPSLWEAVRGSFQARHIDSLLTRMSWVPEVLIEQTPPGGWPVAPAGVLTRDHALSHLTASLLGLPSSDLDPSMLLAWTLDGRPSVFRDQSQTVQQGVISWVEETIGPVAALALTTACQGHSVDAISIGLAADVLWDESATSADAIAARTRLERWTGVRNLPPDVARAFADAARGASQRMAHQLGPEHSRMMVRATALFDDLDYPQGAEQSTVLPIGFDARLRDLARAVREFLASPTSGTSRVEEAFTRLLKHDAAMTHSATATARMAVRLTRWLALPEPESATNLEQAVLRQAREDSFVDWAAADVWVGSTDPEVAAGWAALYESVRARRDRRDREFATLLADATARGTLPDTLVPAESIIATTLLPLAASAGRALLILIDGMSTAVAAELTEEAVRTGWFEAVPGSAMARTATLAVLPTLTKFSRTSMFTGTLQAGGQQEERSGFAALTGGQIFHKADLVGAAGEALPGALLAAINSDVPLHAVVLNTVDDTLAKADPGGLDWTVTQIRHLQALLDEAGRAGRAVILISDHGHVVERGGTPKPIDGAEARWRLPDGLSPDPEREVALTGRRVLAEGGSIIAAVDETLRYTTKQAGYHGGSSAAEAVIPIIVLSRNPDQLATTGWVPAPPQVPAWWNDEVAAAVTVTPTAPSAPKKKEDAGPTLFELEEQVPAPATSATSTLVEDVMASPIYLAQKQRYGARAASDDLVRSALTVLLRQSGRAHRDTLAAAAGIPAMSISGALVTLRRQLNIEGYDVMVTDSDEVTVVLNIDLLRQQFLEGLG